MTIHCQAISFRNKCVSLLSRKDAEFFLSLSTMKDLSIFCLILNYKKVSFKSDFECNLVISRYLQILMLLSSISEDYRDKNLFDRFGLVPFECEKIIKGRRPYVDSIGLQRIYYQARNHFEVFSFFEKAGRDTDFLVSNINKNNHSMLYRILEYYTTPILCTFASSPLDRRNFSFINELQSVLGLVLERHFIDRQNIKGTTADYVRVMEAIKRIKRS